jgi:hypothetical protein
MRQDDDREVAVGRHLPPSSSRVAAAVPDECFRDKGLMSKWIDGNK